MSTIIIIDGKGSEIRAEAAKRFDELVVLEARAIEKLEAFQDGSDVDFRGSIPNEHADFGLCFEGKLAAAQTTDVLARAMKRANEECKIVYAFHYGVYMVLFLADGEKKLIDRIERETEVFLSLFARYCLRGSE